MYAKSQASQSADVVVQWRRVGDDDEWLSLRRALYAYVHPRSDRILYIGKADGCSVRERLGGTHKRAIARFFRKALGFARIRLFIGVLGLPVGSRLSRALMADVESLLIARLLPCANVQCVRTRISRPGLTVLCRGEWPSRTRRFVDLVACARERE